MARSLTNAFATDPLTAASTSLPQAQKTTKPTSGFEDMAIQTGVPVNILVAEAERAGTSDPASVATRAAAWQARMARGVSIEDAAVELVPDDPKGFLQRAIQIDREAYGDPAPEQPAMEPQAAEAGAIENTARTIGGAATRFGASAIKGVGVALDTVADVATLGQSRRDIHAAEVAHGDGEGPGPQEGHFFKDATEIAAAPVRSLADAIEGGRSADLNADIQNSQLKGTIWNPSTWEVSEDATLRGFAHKGLAVLGDLMPVVATSVLTRGRVGPAMAVGGLSAGGAAAEDAKEQVLQAYAEKDASGVSRLEQSSDKFRDLVAQGMEPDQAAMQLAENASQFAGEVAGMIGGAGGAATARVMAPAAGSALASTVGGKVALGAVEEGAQEVAEGVGQRAATNVASGLQDSIGEGTLEEAALGAVAGGALAGATAPFDPKAQPTPDAPLQLPPPALVTPGPSGYGPDGNAIRQLPAPAPAPQAPAADPAADRAGHGLFRTPPPPGLLENNPTAQPPARPKGLLESIMDDTVPTPGGARQGDTITIAPADAPAMQGTYVGETPQAIVTEMDGERVDIPRDEVESGQTQIAPGSLPVPPLPVGTFDTESDPETGEIGTIAVTDTGPFDYDTTFPAPDPDLFAAAAAEGLPVPKTPQDAVTFLSQALGLATDRLLDVQAANEGSPKQRRAQKELDRIWQQVGRLYGPDTVNDMRAAVDDYAGMVLEAAPQPDTTPQPAPQPAPQPDPVPAQDTAPAKSEADLRAEIAAATSAALDEADAEDATAASPQPKTDDARADDSAGRIARDEAVAQVNSGMEYNGMKVGDAVKAMDAAGAARPSPERLAEIRRAAHASSLSDGTKTINYAHNDSEGFRALGIAPITTAERVWSKIAMIESGDMVKKGQNYTLTPEAAAALDAQRNELRTATDTPQDQETTKPQDGATDTPATTEGDTAAPAVRLTYIRQKAALLTGVGKDAMPEVGKVTFTWDAKEGGWTFRRTAAVDVADALGIQTPEAAERAKIDAKAKAEGEAKMKTIEDAGFEWVMGSAGDWSRAMFGTVQQIRMVQGGWKMVDPATNRSFGDVADEAGIVKLADATMGDDPSPITTSGTPDAEPEATGDTPAQDAPATDRQAEDTNTAEALGFKIDNPGGRWLDGKIERAAADMADKRYKGTATGKGLTGSTTGYFKTPLFIPVDRLRLLNGAMDEKPRPGQPKYDDLMAEVAKEGFKEDQTGNAVLVGVNHTGEAFILEGNNRVAVAQELGLTSLRTEVRYFNGGEAKHGRMSPDQLAKIASTQPIGETSTAPRTEATTDAKGTPMPATSMPPPTINQPDPNPTDGQKEAGNYKMGHRRWNGLDISIETAKGSERTGKGPDGKTWSVTLPADYGYIKRTEGADGDHIDIYMGEMPDSDTVVIVNQVDAETGAFDEHKVVAGTGSTAAALRLYEQGFSDGKGKDRIGSFTATSQAGFKAWLETGDHSKPTEPVKQKTTKPQADKTTEPQDDDTATDGDDDTGTEVATTGERIEDFGEKIGGARKDKAQRMADDMGREVDAVSMTMAEAFPIPDYPALAANGVPHRSLAAIAALRAVIPRKPQRYAASWGRKVTKARTAAAKLIGGTYEGTEDAREKVEDIHGYTGSGVTLDAYALLPVDMLHDASTLAVVTPTFKSGLGLGRDVAYYNVGAVGKWRTTQANTVEDAAKVLMKLVADKRAKQEARKGTGGRKPVELAIYSDRATGKKFVGFSVSEPVAVSPMFETHTEARTYLDANREALQQAAEALRDGPDERGGKNRTRKGPAHRTTDATPEMFTDAFGFRGVEFGNYVEGKARQDNLNDAYDALTDLAGLLGIPTRALSLDGALGLAFGARGTGGRNPAAAHYEPDRVVINLTKGSGAGSLAHEWLHALDHHLAKLDASEGGPSAAHTGIKGRRSEYMSDRETRGYGKAKDTADAYRALRNAMTQGDHAWLRRSKEFDRARSTPYFATTIELAARSFEKYVVDRLMERGMVNDYLANIAGYSGAYPSTREMKQTGIRAAWDTALGEGMKILERGTGTAPKLPDADTSRLYDGPEAGEVWDAPDGKKRIEKRQKGKFFVLHPDMSTEVLSRDEVDAQIEADRQAVQDAKEAQKDAQVEAYGDRMQRNRDLEAKAERLIAQFERTKNRKPGAVRNALFGKYYNFGGDMGSINRAVAMLIVMEEKGWRVKDSHSGRNLIGPKGNVYGRDTWTKAGIDFAEWYGARLDARVAPEAPAPQTDTADTEAELRAKIADEVARALDDAASDDTEKPANGKDQKTTGPRGAGEAASSAVKNLGTAADEAMAGLRKLFGDPDTLNMGPAFSRETYAKAKPHFDTVLRALGAAKTDLGDLARALVGWLKTQKMDPAARRAMEPYLNEYLYEVQTKAHDPFNPKEDTSAGTAGTPSDPDTADTGPEGEEAQPAPQGVLEGEVSGPNRMQPVTDAALARFRDGDGFTNIIQARKMAGEALGTQVAEADYKAVEEAIEEAVVVRARELIAEGDDPKATYDKLVALYGLQPLLAQRSSNSIELQAYSTPAPLAYLAGKLAGITAENTVLEPTAGMGMLTITADPANVTANELDPLRAAAIRRTTPGASVTNADATTVSFRPHDVTITNPPFGAVFVAGKRQTWPLGKVKTNEVDHAIAWQVLEAMPDDGSAVLILGGVKKQLTGDERVKAYRSTNKIKFYKTLYDTYNVVDHFTVSGDLYKRQGAAWPVDIIVIRGRSASLNPLPQKEAPPIFNSWAELEGKLDLADSLGTAEVTADRSGADQPQGGQPNADLPAISGPDAGQGGRPDPVGGPRGTQTDAGTRTGDPATGQQGTDGAGNSDTGSDGRGSGAGSEPAGVSGDTDAEGQRRGPRGDAGGTDVDGPVERPDGAVTRENTEVESAFQVQYAPRSQARFAVGTLVPRKMQEAMDRALNAIADEHGDIDTYVAGKLGYTRDEVVGTDDKPGYFSAEQVDALAMAISNVAKNKGFIIGDQTGVGKGRFVAAMLRYAEKQGLTPVFITKATGLYGDMIRDLRDIGEAEAADGVFVTDTTLRGTGALPLSDALDDTLQNWTAAPHKKAVADMTRTGRPPEGVRYVFTTYSQLQTVKGKEPPRRDMLRALAPNAMFVLDESHEAGGTGKKDWAKEDAPEDRATFIRGLLAAARGGVFSSATYAKSPEVMSLYAITDLSLAVEDIEGLAAAMEKGGVPLQQVTANMLVESGQYARRERSFDGISMDLVTVDVNMTTAADATARIADIFDTDVAIMQAAREAAIENMAEQGYANTKDGAVGVASGNSVNFASVLHNVVGQLQLALKVDQVAERAIAAHKAGEKPIIAVYNTNGALLDAIVTEQGLELGDAVNVPFKTILHNYVERLRRITVRDEGADESIRIELTDAQLGPTAANALRRLHKEIDATDFGTLSGSPLDVLHDKLRAAGIRSGEITGRGRVIEGGVLTARDSSSAAKKRVMADYNRGDVDALIINQSGSTGFSLHALERPGNDGKKRMMIIMQPDPNIDVFMQMLGRIHRTGQSQLPRYEIAVTPLAADKRTSAILMRKMASLNANTTASKDSAVSIDNVTDFLNQVGDKIVRQYLMENFDLAVRLDIDEEKENLAQAVTGRMSILPPDEADRIYAEMEDRYNAEIAELNRLGENPLEAMVYDWQAETIASSVVEQGKGSGSPFDADTVMHYLSVRRLTKPYTWAEVEGELFDALGGQTGETIAMNAAQHVSDVATNYQQGLIDKVDVRRAAYDAAMVEDAKAGKKEASATTTKALTAWNSAQERYNAARTEIVTMVQNIGNFEPGRAIRLETGQGPIYGVILDVDASAIDTNPLAKSKVQVRIAVADAARELRLPLSRFEGEGAYAIEDAPRDMVQFAFDAGQSSAREVRAVATGNFINALARFGAGQIAFYTDADGKTQTGLVMPKSFNIRDALEKEPVRFKNADQIATFLRKPDRMVTTGDGMLRMISNGDGSIALEARAKAKPYHVGKEITAITGEWTGRGSAARKAEIWPHDLAKLVKVYTDNVGATFTAETYKDEARAATGMELPEIELPPGAAQRRPVQGLRTRRATLRRALYDQLANAGIADVVSLTLARAIVNRSGTRIDGYQKGRVIAVAMEGDDPALTLDHEIMHAMRDADLWGRPGGLIGDTEWRALVRQVRRQPERLTNVKALYPDLNAREQMEEAVAELYADWRAGRDVDTARGIMGRLQAILDAIRAVLRREGYTSATQVMAAVADGTLAARARETDPTPPDGGTTPPQGSKERRGGAGAATGPQSRTSILVNRAIAASMEIGDKVKDAATKQSMRALVSNAMDQGETGTSILALVPGRALLTELARDLPSSFAYLKSKEAMDALRNRWAMETDDIAKKWQRLSFWDRTTNRAFMDLMHEATLLGIDPQTGPLDADTMKRLVNEEGGDPQEARVKIRNSYSDLRGRFEALPPEWKTLWSEIRDGYARLADDWDDAILANHERSVERAVSKMRAESEKDQSAVERGTLSKGQKEKAIARLQAELADAEARARRSGQRRILELRAAFESNRVQKPYFPLARFGNYYVTLKDEAGKVVSFSRFKGEKEQLKFAADMEGKHEVITGVLEQAGDRLDRSVDAGFVAEIADILERDGVDDEVMDAVWQRYLETMPDMSLRKNRIHRKGTEGYTDDALRAFANHMFHGAHQLARLTHKGDMDAALDAMSAETAKARDPNRAMHVVNEVNKRHAFTMSPKNAGWTAVASSIAFVWYLGFTPAAAAVNLTQTTVIGIPMLTAKYKDVSVATAARALGAASRDLLQGKGFTEKSSRLTADERTAMAVGYDRGLMDKTQAADIAGIAETGIRYSPVKARAMAVIGFAYHHAERANREVTFLAAYRLGIAQGLPHESAIDKAAKTTWDTHFDYQNNSRPRFMQDDWPKVLLTFRNFNVNMIYRMVRDTHQSLHGATPDLKREARRQLVGITGQMAIHAGITGTWGYGMVMMIVGLFFGGAGGDDEAEQALKKLMVGSKDPETALGHMRRFVGSMALYGVPGTLTGTALSERLGMPNLWFREPFSDLEGRAAYTDYLTQLVGPVPGIAEKAFVAASQISEGRWIRGTETAAPKFIRDWMRAGRYLNEGVTTYSNGDPVLEDVSIYQAMVQALGFTPAEVAERYDTNAAMKRQERRIEDARGSALAGIRRAVRDEGRLTPEALEAMQRYNQSYPEWPITKDTITRSLAGARRASENNTGGVNINDRLKPRIMENTAPTVFG